MTPLIRQENSSVTNIPDTVFICVITDRKDQHQNLTRIMQALRPIIVNPHSKLSGKSAQEILSSESTTAAIITYYAVSQHLTSGIHPNSVSLRFRRQYVELRLWNMRTKVDNKLHNNWSSDVRLACCIVQKVQKHTGCTCTYTVPMWHVHMLQQACDGFRWA